MKIKDFNEHRNKPAEELMKELRENREKLNDLRFDLAEGKVKNIRDIKATKKNIAQILTILKEKHA